MLIDTAKLLNGLEGYKPNNRWREKKSVSFTCVQGLAIPETVTITTTSDMDEIQVIVRYDVVEQYRTPSGAWKFVTERQNGMSYRVDELERDCEDGWGLLQFSTEENIREVVIHEISKRKGMSREGAYRDVMTEAEYKAYYAQEVAKAERVQEAIDTHGIRGAMEMGLID